LESELESKLALKLAVWREEAEEEEAEEEEAEEEEAEEEEAEETEESVRRWNSHSDQSRTPNCYRCCMTDLRSSAPCTQRNVGISYDAIKYGRDSLPHVVLHMKARNCVLCGQTYM
jgi:hypothetical protein